MSKKKKQYKDLYTVDRDPINNWSKTIKTVSCMSNKADNRRKQINKGD